MRFRVSAPASSANLGPGFDALGLAIDLWNEVTVDTEREGTVIAGSDAAQLQDKDNYTLFAMRELATLYERELPSFGLELRADVPVARGMGSSAAALVCGLMAANELTGLGLSIDQIFLEAWRMEGHGDNVGAAVYGGAILAVPGLHRAVQLLGSSSLTLQPVVFIPEATSATWAARAALPATVPMPDAAHNVGAASGLAIGLLTGDREAIAAGMHDRLHEPYRARLFPHLTPMTDAARSAGAIGACLSGAGPTILALVEPESIEAVKEALHAVAADHQVPGRVEVIAIAARGAELVEDER
ncbi:MAG: homoserine kinase [Thermomicrobiales bacterium]|nr:homoserine kinase [Thermomicrobiales bacterium]